MFESKYWFAASRSSSGGSTNLKMSVISCSNHLTCAPPWTSWMRTRRLVEEVVPPALLDLCYYVWLVLPHAMSSGGLHLKHTPPCRLSSKCLYLRRCIQTTDRPLYIKRSFALLHQGGPCGIPNHQRMVKCKSATWVSSRVENSALSSTP